MKRIPMKKKELIAEIEFKDSDSENGYPRIVTTDKYKDITKSERLVEVIKELTQEAVKAYNETNN